ncbi:MAG: alpha/beta hydrolase [Proteobacteria bacterium]|nr:alpha/beta hydrolase [Burkholderiales bacterium]
MPIFERTGEPDLHYVVDDFTDPWREAPTLILQHGNGRSAAFWYRCVPYLARFYRVVRPDMRGLGGSPGGFDLHREMTVPQLIEDLAALIAHVDARPVHFCGESLGGILGLAVAALHPTLLRTLTLVATPVFINDTMKQSYALGRGSRVEAMRELGAAKWVDTTNRSTRFPPDTEEGLLAWYAQTFAGNDFEVQLRLVELVNEANAQEFLPKVTLPVLGLYPEAGPITDAEQERLLAASLVDFRIARLPTRYHMVHMIHPATCARRLLAFIATHDGIDIDET